MVEDDRYFRKRMINFCQLEGIETAAKPLKRTFSKTTA